MYKCIRCIKYSSSDDKYGRLKAFKYYLNVSKTTFGQKSDTDDGKYTVVNIINTHYLHSSKVQNRSIVVYSLSSCFLFIWESFCVCGKFSFPVFLYIYIFVAQFCLADGTGSCQGAGNPERKKTGKIESFDL